MSTHTPGHVRWQSFGGVWALVSEEGPRHYIVLGADVHGKMEMPVLQVSDSKHLLIPLTPDHPDAARLRDCWNALAGKRTDLLSPLLALAGYAAGMLAQAGKIHQRPAYELTGEQLIGAINQFNNAVPQPQGDSRGDGQGTQKAHADDGRSS